MAITFQARHTGCVIWECKMEQYAVLFTLRIEHGYYRDKKCRDIEVRISRQSERTRMNRKWIFKQVAVNEWQLFGQPDDNNEAEEEKIELDLILKDHAFAGFTDLPGYCAGCMFEAEINAPDIEIKSGGSSLVWRENGLTKQIGTIGMKPGPGLRHSVLAFFSRRLKWEYIFVARNGKADRKLLLAEITGRLKFGDMEQSDFSGFPVWRCLTQEPVTLHESYDYVLRLFEEKPMGRRLLCRELDFPRLGQYAVENTGLIRQVVYY